MRSVSSQAVFCAELELRGLKWRVFAEQPPPSAGLCTAQHPRLTWQPFYGDVGPHEPAFGGGGEGSEAIALSTSCPPCAALGAGGSPLWLGQRRGRLGRAAAAGAVTKWLFFVPHCSGAAGSGCGVQRPPCAGRAAIGCARRAGPRERQRDRDQRAGSGRLPLPPPASAHLPGVGLQCFHFKGFSF